MARQGGRRKALPRVGGAARLRRNVAVTARWEQAHEVLLYDMDTERAVVTDEAGLVVFWLCDGERRFRDLMRELRRRYRVTEEAAKDIRRFVRVLVSCGIVQQDVAETAVEGQPESRDLGGQIGAATGNATAGTGAT